MTTEGYSFDLLTMFNDTNGIYLISSATDYYDASCGIWLVGLTRRSDQNFIAGLHVKQATLTLVENKLVFNSNYISPQRYIVNALKLA